jgi:hypothetical protein
MLEDENSSELFLCSKPIRAVLSLVFKLPRTTLGQIAFKRGKINNLVNLCSISTKFCTEPH